MWKHEQQGWINPPPPYRSASKRKGQKCVYVLTGSQCKFGLKCLEDLWKGKNGIVGAGCKQRFGKSANLKAGPYPQKWCRVGGMLMHKDWGSCSNPKGIR